MSILSYRLKEKLINNTWPFDINFINEYILCNKQINDSLNLEELKNFYNEEKPILYENSQVIYKEVNYGNCMESTILQFLKIIFWNPKIEYYDFNYINTVINEKYNEFITYIFTNIYKEKTRDFDLEWVEFVTELPFNNDLYFDNYEFINTDKKIELNPTYSNLILFLRYITRFDEYNILEAILQEINEDYSFAYEQYEQEVITLNLYKQYKMNLISNRHANFEGSKFENDINNILSEIRLENKKMHDYLVDNKKITYSDINNYIFYDFIENKENILYKKYFEKINNKYNKLLFVDANLGKININIFLNISKNEYILDTWKIKEEYGNTIWHYAVQYIESEDFWMKISENKEILETWKIQDQSGNTVWHFAVQYIKDEDFWNKISDYEEILETWIIQDPIGDTVWHFAVQYIKDEDFWMKISEYKKILETWKIQEKYGFTVWHSVVQYIKDNNFWMKISEYEDILETWKIQDQYGDTVWHRAVQNIKDEDFWNKISEYEEILKTWIIQDQYDDTVWHFAVQYIKDEDFWNKISEYKEILETWKIQEKHGDTVWHSAVQYIESEDFWMKISEYEKILETWEIQGKFDYTVWHSAVQYIKDNNFWMKISENKKILETWKIQDEDDNTVWHNAVLDIKNNIFWMKISENKEILETWTIKGQYGDTVWYKAFRFLTDNNFWNKISEYNNIICSDKKLFLFLKKRNEQKRNEQYKNKYFKYKQKYLSLQRDYNIKS